MTRKHDFRISTYALLHRNLLGMSLESLVPRFKSSIIFHYNSSHVSDSSLKVCIDGLQSLSRESNEKDVAAMLDELTIEANEASFVIVLQHGGNDLT